MQTKEYSKDLTFLATPKFSLNGLFHLTKKPLKTMQYAYLNKSLYLNQFLIGLSFGGPMAIEIAKQIGTKK